MEQKILQKNEYAKCIRLDSGVEKTIEECELFTITMLQEIKKLVDEQLPDKNAGTEIDFDVTYHFNDKFENNLCRWWTGEAIGTYGYNRHGKPKCKLRRWGANPGGMFFFPANRVWFTEIQNLIKYFVENGQTESNDSQT